MKDKLRELAERLAIRIGSQPCTSISSKEVCEFLSILDAEGDGGAVQIPELRIGAPAWPGQMEGKAPPEGWVQLSVNNLPPHPARSVVVSDEDVSVVAKMIADRIGNGMREKYEELAKQIAEHFAALAQEKQS